MSSGKVKIMGREYRIIHLLNIFAGFALLFTGIGSSPGILNTFFHTYFGITSVAFFHNYLGLATIVVIACYGAYLISVNRVRLFDGFRKKASNQLEEAKAILRNYANGTPLPTDVRKGMARHNVLASYASVLLTIGFGELVLSGISLIFLNSGSELYKTMLLVHNTGIYLTAAFFFLHLFAVLKGENRPLLRAVFTNGEVSLNWAKDHMPKFLEKIS
jgi:formate dehydrogenase subunit gamma